MSFPCLARQLVDLPDGRVRVIFEKLRYSLACGTRAMGEAGGGHGGLGRTGP